jgi:hypothetical protein
LCEISELIEENLNVTDSYMNKTNLMHLSILNNIYNKKQAGEILKILDENKFIRELEEQVVNYLEDRSERNSNMTIKSFKILIQKIIKINNESYTINLLEESIMAEWKSIFPNKSNQSENKSYKELTEKDLEDFSNEGCNL